MRFIIIFILFLNSFLVFSQDQIFKKDNTKIDTKILEIGVSEIKYKLFTYQDGPVISIYKADVVMIIYQNGTHEVFNSPSNSPKQIILPYKTNQEIKLEREKEKRANFEERTITKNLVSVNLAEFLDGSIGFSFLKELPNYFFHLYVPISVGVTTPYLSNDNSFTNSTYPAYYDSGPILNYKYSLKTTEIGLGIHLHTSGKRSVTHFIGPYIGYSQMNGTFDENPNYYYTSQGVYNNRLPLINHGFVLNRTSFLIDNGLLIRVVKHFNILAIVGFGYQVDNYISNNPENFITYNQYYYKSGSFPVNAFKVGLSMGYRF